MDYKQEVHNFNGSTTHPGRYVCTYALLRGVWFLVGMEKL